MKTVKLNCASCGAPIVIPDDVDTVVCASCKSTLMVDRGEGYITLKVIEKLARSIQDMGEMTSSAIKENAYVTQVELKRMQLNQLISMEEMKINSLQAEIRSVKRRTAGAAQNAELGDLLLQENDVRMHIRQSKTDIAHLDPGWEESLEVIRRDARLVDEAIAQLAPYAQIPAVQSRLQSMQAERERCQASYDQLEVRLLQRELESGKYPSFSHLSLEEMEQLLEIIPADLRRLQNWEQTQVNLRLQKEMQSTLERIKAVYPRRKVESEAGKLSTLDLNEPYPEEPEKLQLLIARVKEDLAKLAEIPDSGEKTQFVRLLSEKLRALTARAESNIPAMKAKRKKRKRITILAIFGVMVVGLLTSLIAAGAASNRRKATLQNENLLNQATSSGPNSEPRENLVDQSVTGAYESTTAAFLEITSSVTYLREQPDLNAPGSYKVESGTILQVLPEESLSNQWYKVATMDGAAAGYLAQDWVIPVTVRSVGGDGFTEGASSTVYAFDFSAFNADWDEDAFEDEYAQYQYGYVDGWYELDVTANDTYIYSYSNYTLDNLPDQYSFSLTLDPVELQGGTYYGIQTNGMDGSNFDALLVSQEGSVFLLRVRNGYFSILYDTEATPNPWAALDPWGVNTFSVARLLAAGGTEVVYQYAINGRVIAELSQPATAAKGLTMGALIYMDNQGDHAHIRVDDFTVLQ